MASGEGPSGPGGVGHQVTAATESTHSQRDRQTAGELAARGVVHVQVGLHHSPKYSGTLLLRSPTGLDKSDLIGEVTVSHESNVLFSALWNTSLGLS